MASYGVAGLDAYTNRYLPGVQELAGKVTPQRDCQRKRWTLGVSQSLLEPVITAKRADEKKERRIAPFPNIGQHLLRLKSKNILTYGGRFTHAVDYAIVRLALSRSRPPRSLSFDGFILKLEAVSLKHAGAA